MDSITIGATNLRPRYLNRMHQMDFHWVVWNVATNEAVMMFVTDKGSKRGYFTSSFDDTKQSIWFWTDYDHCTYALGQLSKEPWTILNDAKREGLPPGSYKCSITRVGGQRLISYEFTI